MVQWMLSAENRADRNISNRMGTLKENDFTNRVTDVCSLFELLFLLCKMWKSMKWYDKMKEKRVNSILLYMCNVHTKSLCMPHNNYQLIAVVFTLKNPNIRQYIFWFFLSIYPLIFQFDVDDSGSFKSICSWFLLKWKSS